MWERPHEVETKTDSLVEGLEPQKAHLCYLTHDI